MDSRTKIKAVTRAKYATKLIKVVFHGKTTKDEAMEVHKTKPFMWPENLGVFEFLNNSEALSMVKESW